ncbi:MAG TPA: glycosyltransferase [Pyrinomonadaceae bacterium]|jgi:glycosyltransferase involved in cell wall biosynthesis
MLISIIVPAYNEEKYISLTLGSIKQAQHLLLNEKGIPAEIIVVDNDSTDSTANIALSLEAEVIKEPTHNVAKVRNVGASLAKGNILVFVDADVIVPERLLCRIHEAMSDELCLGGAVDTNYRPAKFSVKVYLRMWRLVGKIAGMAQGATQFCRKDIYASLNGYDETLYMGEDVDFYWRLKRFAKRCNSYVQFIGDIQVSPSSRRFDEWSMWRTVVWTNPIFILVFRRRKSVWKGWYSAMPR